MRLRKQYIHLTWTSERSILCFLADPSFSRYQYALVDTQADEHFQTRTLNFATEEGASLPIGKALLTIDFTSVVHSQETGYGVYQVKFDDGTIGYTTQFEPVGAREAFPCFDEPAIRAIFEVRL